MDEFEDLPDDLADVEVIYSDNDEDFNTNDTYDEELIEDNQIETEVIDLSVLTFSKHSKSVFTSAVSKNQTIAVTGGEDDTAYVWDIKTGEVIFECTGHKDSVTEVSFNHNDQYIVTGDMSGLIQVWSIQEKKLIWCYEGDDMVWLTWHPLTNILICGCQSGDIYIWQIPSGNCKVLPSPNNVSCSCGKILPNGKQLIVGYEDGQVRLWDIKGEIAIWTNNDSTCVNNLDINSDGSLIITAPEAKIIKTSNGMMVGRVLIDNENEIECALFYDDLGFIITGALSGQICVWQLGKFVLRHQAKIESAVTLMKKGNNNNVYIGATDGAVYVCDVKGGTLKEVLTGHKADILSLSVFSGERNILTTSDDGMAKIFDIKD
ncbi:hypothetical protein GWI33_022443 [Rhynchophorus ferrugineus]|uniref:Angio-associated migratory cell protein n=1 Tax=Rhynchophorus ferrugineus TaxID=354439 RepID=A0A834INH5_RHYFE|nr:hypothetical protein GWI33_022443 [Rhynchophorus ferrugineus]